MKNYLKHLGHDGPASIVVFLVAVPLCLGIAVGSGLPPIMGLIGGIIGGLIVGLISNSNLSVSGPAAGLIATVSIITAQISDELLKSGVPAPEIMNKMLAIFLLIVFIAGIIQVALGLLKAGVVVSFVPVSVLKGMLTAIGILLILKQLPHLVGYDADFEGDQEFFQLDGRNTFSEIEVALMHITPLAAVIGVLGIGIQFFWDSKYFPLKKIKHLIPGPLIVVAMGAGVSYYFFNVQSPWQIKTEHMVTIPVLVNLSKMGEIVRMPDFTAIGKWVVWMGAIQIAIIASIESLLSVEAIDKLDTEKRRTNLNRELIAQGTGNMAAGLMGGLPVTSVIVRSSANVTAGAKTKMSAILHGVILAASVLFFPKILNLIPLSALAAILIYTGFKLAKPSIFSAEFKKGRAVFIPFMVTVIAILLSDLLIGICIGILVGLFFMIKSNFHAALRFAEQDNTYLIRFGNQVTFLNKLLLKTKLDSIAPGSSVLIDVSRSNFIDHDIVEMLSDFTVLAEKTGILLEIKYKNDNQRDTLNEYKTWNLT